MTYLELYEDALQKLHNSLITLGEFETMIEPLNREIELEPKTGKWTEIENGEYLCSNCLHITIGYPPSNCPNCGSFNGSEEE